MHLPVTAAAFAEEVTVVLAVMMCRLVERLLIDAEFVGEIILVWAATVYPTVARKLTRVACVEETVAAAWVVTAFPTAAKLLIRAEFAEAQIQRVAEASSSPRFPHLSACVCRSTSRALDL